MKNTSIALGALAATVIAAPLLAGGDLEEAALAMFAIERSGITLAKALSQAEAAAPGIAYEYELEDEDGKLFHEIKIMDLKSATRHKIIIAVADGSLEEEKEKRRCGMVCRDDDVLAARALQDSGYSLKQALTDSGADQQQLLEDAELELNRGVRYFKLEWVGPDGEYDQLIDIDSGTTIPALGNQGS